LRSPSVQMRITPLGDLEMISTHDQILAAIGPDLPGVHIPRECGVRARNPGARHAHRQRAQVEGVLGRFGVDFVSVPAGDRWRHCAIEINLRKGGTTHTFQMLQFLTQGRYDAGRAEFVTPSGETRCYYATDNVVSPAYRRLTPEDLFEIAERRGLRWTRPTRPASRSDSWARSPSSASSDGGDRRRYCGCAAPFPRTVAVLDEEA